MNSLAGRTDELFAEWDKSDSPGCTLAVIWDGEIVYMKDRNLQFARDTQGRISGFNARSGRVVNVWFARRQPD